MVAAVLLLSMVPLGLACGEGVQRKIEETIEAILKKEKVIFAYQEEEAFFYQNGKYGLINREGRTLLEPVLDQATYFDKELAIVTMGNKKGVINRQGTWIAELKYAWIWIYESLSEQYILAGEKNPYDMLEEQGRLQVESEIDKLLEEQDFETLVINAKGEEILRINAPWNHIAIREGFVEVQIEKDKYEYISFMGEKITNSSWDLGYVFAEDMILAEKDGLLGFVNRKGEEVLPFRYSDNEYAFPVFSRGLAAVQLHENGVWQYINIKGETVISDEHLYNGDGERIHWENTKPFGEFDIAPVQFNDTGYWRYINKKGEITFDGRWRNAEPFSCGMAAVTDYNTHNDGYINEKGQYVIEPIFLWAYSFENGSAMIGYHYKDKGYNVKTNGYINSAGELLYLKIIEE